MILAPSVHRERYDHQQQERIGRVAWAQKVDGPAFDAYCRNAEQQRPAKKKVRA